MLRKEIKGLSRQNSEMRRAAAATRVAECRKSSYATVLLAGMPFAGMLVVGIPFAGIQFTDINTVTRFGSIDQVSHGPLRESFWLQNLHVSMISEQSR
jgi:hypothetical protein